MEGTVRHGDSLGHMSQTTASSLHDKTDPTCSVLHILHQPTSANVRIHLENTLQLIQMGLTGNPESRGRHLDCIRSTQKQLDQALIEKRVRTQNVAILRELLRVEQLLHRQHAAQQAFHKSLDLREFGSRLGGAFGNGYSDPPLISKDLSCEVDLLSSSRRRIRQLKITLDSLRQCYDARFGYNTVLQQRGDPPQGLLCPPVSSSPESDISTARSGNYQTAYNYEQLSRARAGVDLIKRQMSPLSIAFGSNRTRSENVPLDLDATINHKEPLEQFQPSLLKNRFEKWTLARENLFSQAADSGGGDDLEDEEDLLLLRKEADCLYNHNMDVETYHSLCHRHRSLLLHSTVDNTTLSIHEPGVPPICTAPSNDNTELDAESENNTRVASPELAGRNEDTGDLGDILDNYCILEDMDTGTKPTSQQTQTTIMHLPRMLAWSVCHPDAVLASNAARDHNVRLSDPDFILEESHPHDIPHCAPTMGCTTVPTILRGTLKEIWPKLDALQQRYLMSSLTRMLSGIWDNFDILGGNSLDSLQQSPTKDWKGCTEDESTQVEAERQVHERTRIALTRSHSASIPGTDQTRPITGTRRLTAEENLCRLEDEFMNRSFLDAFNAATAADTSTVANAPLPQTSPFEEINGNANLDGQFGHTRKAFTEGLVRNVLENTDCADADPLNPHPLDMDTWKSVQRMTTTRARARDSAAAQDRMYILPLPASKNDQQGSMRQFDFSLDDLLIQVESTNALPLIVGVSRWKIGYPARTSDALHRGASPRSTNMLQSSARSSMFPLVHLFSLPDIFCPVEFGGQDETYSQRSDEANCLAYDMACLLAKCNPQASEFLTDAESEKARKLYHKWMAAWHERSHCAPTAARTRFELVRTIRRHRIMERKRRIYGIYHEEIDYNAQPVQSDGNSHQYRSVICERTREILRQRHRPLQPSNTERSGVVSFKASVECPRCVEETNENAMAAEEEVRFTESAEFLVRVVAHLEHKQRHKAEVVRAQTRQNDEMMRLATTLGLNVRWLTSIESQGQGQGLVDGMWDQGGDDDYDCRDTPDASPEESHDVQGSQEAAISWGLSKEEQALMRMHLFTTGH
ncbi:hypothetical protein BG011_006871 [Mortierella polycephala]|uniref:Uncharacterized protein n=1 Tax=Mortierella polycephala TaxID=41804 RepID=A0A9P6PSH2_9FUNG|nr:hypothetical protein BG011_006871 [Mortierella polycephala]